MFSLQNPRPPNRRQQVANLLLGNQPNRVPAAAAVQEAAVDGDEQLPAAGDAVVADAEGEAPAAAAIADENGTEKYAVCLNPQIRVSCSCFQMIGTGMPLQKN